MPGAQTGIQIEAQRVTRETKRAIGTDIRQQREDLGLSQARLVGAAGIDRSFLSKIESGEVEPSVHVLAAIGAALGGRVRVRMEPGTGSPLRDHIQARMIEGFLSMLDVRWRRFLEVAVYRPVHGVIDAVLDDTISTAIVASEFHSQLRRLDALIRWARLPPIGRVPVASAARRAWDERPAGRTARQAGLCRVRGGIDASAVPGRHENPRSRRRVPRRADRGDSSNPDPCMGIHIRKGRRTVSDAAGHERAGRSTTRAW